MKTRNLPKPIKWAMRNNPLFGIDWKHIDDDDGENYVYRRTFENLYELLAYVRDRYGSRFADSVQLCHSKTINTLNTMEKHQKLFYWSSRNFADGWVENLFLNGRNYSTRKMGKETYADEP